MGNISRSDLHFNFLKNIVFRIDFQGVFEPEMDRILTLVKPYVKSKGFSRYLKKKNSEVRISVGILDTPESSPNKIVKSQDVHSFVNEDRGHVLDLSNSFVCLNINSTSYTPFEEYRDIVTNIAHMYKENIDFVSIIRVGIRKINICLFKEREQISKFFSSNYFGYVNILKKANSLSVALRDTFINEPYKGTILSSIEQGKDNTQTLYKVSLDSDVYIDDAAIIENNIDYDFMNDMLFDIYVSALAENFRQALSGDDETAFDGIIGIEKNE